MGSPEQKESSGVLRSYGSERATVMVNFDISVIAQEERVKEKSGEDSVRVNLKVLDFKIGDSQSKNTVSTSSSSHRINFQVPLMFLDAVQPYRQDAEKHSQEFTAKNRR